MSSSVGEVLALSNTVLFIPSSTKRTPASCGRPCVGGVESQKACLFAEVDLVIFHCLMTSTLMLLQLTPPSVWPAICLSTIDAFLLHTGKSRYLSGSLRYFGDPSSTCLLSSRPHNPGSTPGFTLHCPTSWPPSFPSFQIATCKYLV